MSNKNKDNIDQNKMIFYSIRKMIVSVLIKSFKDDFLVNILLLKYLTKFIFIYKEPLLEKSNLEMEFCDGKFFLSNSDGFSDEK